MADIFRQFLIWLMAFGTASVGLVLAVQLAARRMRRQRTVGSPPSGSSGWGAARSRWLRRLAGAAVLLLAYGFVLAPAVAELVGHFRFHRESQRAAATAGATGSAGRPAAPALNRTRRRSDAASPCPCGSENAAGRTGARTPSGSRLETSVAGPGGGAERPSSASPADGSPRIVRRPE